MAEEYPEDPPVVDFPFIVIRKDFVSIGDGFELVFGSWLLINIRVEFASLEPKGTKTSKANFKSLQPLLRKRLQISFSMSLASNGAERENVRTVDAILHSTPQTQT